MFSQYFTPCVSHFFQPPNQPIRGSSTNHPYLIEYNYVSDAINNFSSCICDDGENATRIFENMKNCNEWFGKYYRRVLYSIMWTIVVKCLREILWSERLFQMIFSTITNSFDTPCPNLLLTFRISHTVSNLVNRME